MTVSPLVNPAVAEDADDFQWHDGEYRLPSQEIIDIVETPPTLAWLFSPKLDKILFLKQRALPQLAELAKPEEKLAGIRIDGESNTRSRMPFFIRMVIHDINDDDTLGPEKEIHGFPKGAKIHFYKWSPDGRHLAFSSQVDKLHTFGAHLGVPSTISWALFGVSYAQIGYSCMIISIDVDYLVGYKFPDKIIMVYLQRGNSSSKLSVWVADMETGDARCLNQQKKKEKGNATPEIFLNAIFENFVWVDDSTLLVCTIPRARGGPPKKPLVPSGPKIRSHEQKNIIQARTFADLLKDEHDKELFSYYATSQLVLASLDGTMEKVGKPAVYTSMEPSPDGKYLLISSIHKPYSFHVPSERFPMKVDLWTTATKFVRELCALPLAEDIPIASDSVRKGMRSIHWRADKPSTLYWVETQDGGDAKVEVSPRDIIYTQPAEPLEGEQPAVLQKLDLRYGGILWSDDSLALVSESWNKTRQTRTWVLFPGSKDVSPCKLFDRSSEDVYSDPGSPMLRRTPTGTYVIAKIKKENIEGTFILLNGKGATPEGDIPFLDLLDINTFEKERIWESDKEKYYENVVALMTDQNEGDLDINQLKLLTSKESKTEKPQYYIQRWADKKACQITNFRHPHPWLASLQKDMIKYQRKDGVHLTATLYLPPGYDRSKEGPLPCLFWAYPLEFKSKDAAGQVRGSPNEFPHISSTSPLLWLTRRFAVLYQPTIPIIGEGDEEANDRYVEQLVASAEAAVEEVIQLGVAHPNKIALAGHSYGASMTAILLAHSPHLFCCGIARSGAYNRTLTPFGFQHEVRTVWEATTSYVEMSPFMSANKIKKPILLIHGEEDNNSGTPIMQSDRFFNALKGHGVFCRLVMLPFESHSYVARESILHVLWETERWLQKYCMSNTSEVNTDLDTIEDFCWKRLPIK